MGGRHAKPISLHILEGNKCRLTKADIKRRQESEIQLGEKKYTMPLVVKQNTHAKKMWSQVTKLYKSSEVQLASSADVVIMSRFCLTYAEYMDLIERRSFLADAGLDWTASQAIAPEEFREEIEAILKVDPLTKLDNAINKKNDLLTKLEDRLFLNPLAKIKNIPKKDKKPASDPLSSAGFGNV